MNEPFRYQLRGLEKGYGGPFRLRVGHLDLSRGQVVSLLGPTGAGKSSLLRVLAGLEPPSCGEAWFGNLPLDGRALPLSVQRRVTMVFQQPRLLSGTVRANVAYGLRLRGRGGKSPRVDDLIDGLGLARIAMQAARSLSVGQSQLVALARALAVEPDVLLLDEPTAHLDPAHVALVERTILQDNQDRGTTVIWATHHLFQARRVAQRVGLLLNGELVEEGATETFFQNPADPRTAAFVRGEMIY